MSMFILTEKTIAHADARMNNQTVQTLWTQFCLGDGTLVVESGENNTFVIGDTTLPTLPENKEYALRIDENGAAIVGCDYGGLMRGFIALLMQIEADETQIYLHHTEALSEFTIRNRMIHICLFPEHDWYFIQKFVRLIGLCQYTHVVIEFWGMLQYDHLKEMGWSCAFSKEHVRDLIREIRELGMEPIPMLNQLGHATACRLKYGKHVVLDQNPRLQHLFTPDGWAWNIESEKTYDLLAKLRGELYDLFGEGEYIHIGCDEAYYYNRNDELRRTKMVSYLSRITADVAAEGRRPMVWMDMMLENGIYPDCTANCKAEDVKLLQSALHPDTVMVDWQYRCTTVPIPTAMSLKDSGHDVMGAPWTTKPANYRAWVKTIAENDLFGLMMTTWHTMKEELHGVLDCARMCGAAQFPWSRFSGPREETATLLRRVSYNGNTVETAGWSRWQIEV